MLHPYVYKTQSIKNWGMVGFITTAEALPNGSRRSEYRRCFDQAFQLYVRDLGVYVDGDMLLEAHISQLSRTCFSPSSATCRAPESHHGLRSLAHPSTCSQSGRLLQRSAGWPTTDSDQQASIHSPCSSSPCAAATRLGPVSRIWCVCSSTGFPFHRGFSSSCARWCTGVFTTRRRYTYEISACPSRLLRVVLTSDRPQLETFAFHRQRLWQSAGVDFLLPVLRLGTIYPLLWKTLN